MKTSIKVLLIAAIMICTQGVLSQAQSIKNTSGMYLTELDYKSGKLSYVLDKNNKLQLNSFLNGKHVTLIYQGKKVKLSKSEIFGYRENNQDFRFYQNETYRILDTAGFMLYSRQQLAQQGKGYAPVERYFYSVSTANPVLSLTIENIDKSFPAKIEFRYRIQNYFYRDADLMAFDKADNQYEIKYLYFKHKHS
jgi:DNA-binding beta-propeller fold protein YncE